MEIKDYIDHTTLKSLISLSDLKSFAETANQNQFKAVCISPSFIRYIKEYIEHSHLCSVIGFPSGLELSEDKRLQAHNLIKLGCNEIDMVANNFFITNKKFEDYKTEIESIAKTCHENNSILKVILECCDLTDDQIKKATQLCIQAGADFVKTSTGFGSHGAKIEHVKLMKEVAGNDIFIKASGGIRNYEQAMSFINAGASRLGTSSGVTIIQGSQNL